MQSDYRPSARRKPPVATFMSAQQVRASIWGSMTGTPPPQGAWVWSGAARGAWRVERET
ncbi:hypothetical protein P7K49_040389, partial [Saguinus oedipus]